jgi:hypothetical protein
MAPRLERDPQVGALLASRKGELGLGLPVDAGRSLSRNLTLSIGFGRGRWIGM